MILRNLMDNNMFIDFCDLWIPLRSKDILKLKVNKDGLFKKNKNRYRQPVTALDQQSIADDLDCILPTTKIMDTRSMASVVINPVFGAYKMSAQEYSRKVDKKIDIAYDDIKSPLSTIGKSWVLTTKMGKGRYGNQTAYNYGQYYNGRAVKTYSTPAGVDNLRVIQPLSGCHNIDHIDPSQQCFLVKNQCFINEQEYKVSDILSGKEGNELLQSLSYEGKLNQLRY